jgi:hypothetical protein
MVIETKQELLACGDERVLNKLMHAIHQDNLANT